jgi:hypothetical protein
VWIKSYSRPIDDKIFNTCTEVESEALKLASEIPEQTFTIEIHPKSGTKLIGSFISERSDTYDMAAVDALADHSREPIAHYYAVRGGHHLRCRDANGSVSESSTLPWMQSTAQFQVWHFTRSDTDMDHAYVITKEPLDSIDGPKLLRDVSQLLGARFLFLYARNDPWFYGFVSSAMPYVFADLSKRITSLEAFKATKTLICYTDSGCKVR